MKAFFIIFIVAVVGGMAYFWNDGSVSTPSVTTYFYGEECPHCHEVAEFLEKNNIAEKVSFEKKEVWHDRANAKEMDAAVRACGLDASKVGVPLVFSSADNTCYVGTPDVEGFFRSAAGI